MSPTSGVISSMLNFLWFCFGALHGDRAVAFRAHRHFTGKRRTEFMAANYALHIHQLPWQTVSYDTQEDHRQQLAPALGNSRAPDRQAISEVLREGRYAIGE